MQWKIAVNSNMASLEQDLNMLQHPKHEDKRHGCEIDMILNKHELRAHLKTCWNTIKQAWQDSIS